jgi:predicted nucleotidyltransferase
MMQPNAPSPDREAEVEHVLAEAVSWLSTRPDVVAVGLAGSWARGAPREDSDVDLLVLTAEPAAYTTTDDWIGQLGGIEVSRKENWGPITERRVRRHSGLEVEVSIGEASWAGIQPVDPGTRRVVRDGFRVLYDPLGVLTDLMRACA